MFASDNSTLLQYQFSFCLYLDEHSGRRCKSGKFTSLPPQSRDVLLNITFDEEVVFDSGTQDVTPPSEATKNFSAEAVVSISLAVFFLVCLLGMVVYRLRRAWKKMWSRNSLITIPNIDIDMDREEHSLFKINHIEENVSPPLETLNLLEHKDRSSSIETFNEYDISPSNSPSLENQRNSDTENYRNIVTTIHKREDEDHGIVKKKNSPDISYMKKHATKKVGNENIVPIHTEDVHIKQLCRKNDTALVHNVLRCDVRHVKSPTGGSNNEEHNEDNEIVALAISKNEDQNRDNDTVAVSKAIKQDDEIIPVCRPNIEGHVGANVVAVSDSDIEDHSRDIRTVAFGRSNNQDHNGDNETVTICTTEKQDDNGGNEIITFNTSYNENHNGDAIADYNSYNWDKIFMYMASKILHPKTYFQFFIELLSQAGCENPDTTISEIEAETPNNVKRMVFKLLNRWKQGVGSDVDPKHIENAFETQELKSQLDDFRSYMRNPPLLNDRNKWHEPFNEHEKRQILFTGRSEDLLMISKERQPFLALPSDISFQTSEKITIQHGHNGEGILRRSHSFVQNRKDRRMISSSNSTIESSASSSCSISRYDTGYGSSLTETGQSSSGLSLKEIDNPNISECQSKQCQIPQEFSTKESLNGDEQTAVPHPISQLQDDCQANFRYSNVPSDHDLMSNSSKKNRSSNQNRKRHILHDDDNVNGCPLKTKKKCVGNSVNFERKYKNALRRNKRVVTKLVEFIERDFELGRPIDKENYDIFIDDLLERLSERPQKDDLVSLPIHSFRTADSFKTNTGEMIHVIQLKKDLLLLREKEWTSLKTYVEHARTSLLEKIQPNLNTDNLFLCYNGKPMVNV